MWSLQFHVQLRWNWIEKKDRKAGRWNTEMGKIGKLCLNWIYLKPGAHHAAEQKQLLLL